MTKPVELSLSQWNRLVERLRQDYPPSVTLIRSKMKSTLGFVNREYKDWDPDMGKWGGWRENCVVLDFYSEKKRTFFLVKYSEYIQRETVNDKF